jgi:hypothetical protein
MQEARRGKKIAGIFLAICAAVAVLSARRAPSKGTDAGVSRCPPDAGPVMVCAPTGSKRRGGGGYAALALMFLVLAFALGGAAVGSFGRPIAHNGQVVVISNDVKDLRFFAKLKYDPDSLCTNKAVIEIVPEEVPITRGTQSDINAQDATYSVLLQRPGEESAHPLGPPRRLKDGPFNKSLDVGDLTSLRSFGSCWVTMPTILTGESALDLVGRSTTPSISQQIPAPVIIQMESPSLRVNSDASYPSSDADRQWRCPLNNDDTQSSQECSVVAAIGTEETNLETTLLILFAGALLGLASQLALLCYEAPRRKWRKT